MTSVTTDGNLPAALDRLYIAVAALLDPVKEMHDGRIFSGPSLYEQLLDELPAVRGNGQGRAVRRSLPPVWADALDLQIEIDDTTRRWRPVASTPPARLRALAAQGWRPQDTPHAEHIAGSVEYWCVTIQSLLHPASVKHISAPCPACAATSVYRRDSAGEHVRVPALQLVTKIGCTCQACRYTWAPEYYMHLARVLGFEMPAGVLE